MPEVTTVIYIARGTTVKHVANQNKYNILQVKTILPVMMQLHLANYKIHVAKVITDILVATVITNT